MRRKLAGLAVSAGVVVGMVGPFAGTAHANTNTSTPTVLDCEQTFASQGLATIRAFQASDKGFQARFLLSTALEAAELNFETCLSRATT